MGKFQAAGWTVLFCVMMRKTIRKRQESFENSFYNYLTMGMLRTLNGMLRVCNIKYEPRGSCTDMDIRQWEIANGVVLPSTMRHFFKSTDGFRLTWCFDYGNGDVKKVGLLQVPRLFEIKTLITLPDFDENYPKPPADTEPWINLSEPQFSKNTKIFNFYTIGENAMVCMVYEKCPTEEPKFYLLETGLLKWQFLAATFVEFWRMSIIHLGMPYWELLFSPICLPNWAEQLFLLLAPHLAIECEPRLQEIEENEIIKNSNEIDSNIFFETMDSEETNATTSHDKN